MNPVIRILAIVFCVALVLMCAFILPFPGWPLWFAVCVGVLELAGIGGAFAFLCMRD